MPSDVSGGACTNVLYCENQLIGIAGSEALAGMPRSDAPVVTQGQQ